jgi:nucleotide-binding universal stress UspA family protein
LQRILRVEANMTAAVRRSLPGRSAAFERAFVPIRRILCPVDFSEFSRAAVERAVALAAPFQAEITALFVLPLALPEDAERYGGPVAPEAAVQSAVAEDLEEFLRPARDAGLVLRLCIRSGDPVAHILEEARRRESDLIVMGTHGRSGFERWVLGSVTDSVLRGSPCPVLAVPLRAALEPVTGRIVCAVRLSAQDDGVLDYALALGRSMGSMVAVVHVWDWVGGARVRAACETELRRRLHAAVVRGAAPQCQAEEIVVAGSPHREILRVAATGGAGLVVLGGDGLGPGAVTRRMLREAAVPVLVVAPQPREEP